MEGPERALLPPRACDCHFHVFGPADRYPYNELRSYTPPDAMLEDYLALLKRLSVERCVIVQPSVYGVDNRLLMDSLEVLGDRARGVVVVDETVDDETLATMHEKGVRALRFNLLFAGGVDLSAIDRLAARVSELGWHAQLLIDARDLPEIADRLAGLPTDLVFDHMGHVPAGAGTADPGFRKLLALLRAGRSWVKLSAPYRMSGAASPYADVADFARELIEAAPDRCVWGTDWPHPAAPGQPPPFEELLALLYDWARDAATARAILAENSERLYWS